MSATHKEANTAIAAAFAPQWHRLVNRRFKPYGPEWIPETLDELRDFALEFFTDGFAAGEDFAARE